MKPVKPLGVRKPGKNARPRKKRNLDNSSLKGHFGKSPEGIWDKDIHTGEGNFSF